MNQKNHSLHVSVEQINRPKRLKRWTCAALVAAGLLGAGTLGATYVHAAGTVIAANGQSAKAQTAVTVSTPDQISNLAAHRQQAIANGTYAAVANWADLQAAWASNQYSYIEITAHISNTGTTAKNGDLAARTSSVIVASTIGSTYTLDLAGGAFNMGAAPVGSTFTLSHVDLRQTSACTNTGDSGEVYGKHDAAIDTNSASNGKWIFNLDNITLNPDKNANINTKSAKERDLEPRRLLDAGRSLVVLSGNIQVVAKQEMMQIGQVQITNGAHVELKRTANTTGYPMFYFLQSPAANTTGTASTFTVGDNATLIGNEYSNYSCNCYPLVYKSYNAITVGDNVKWSQNGFGKLFSTLSYTGTKPSVQPLSFGKNLEMTALRTMKYESIDLNGGAVATFSEGTVFDLQQWYSAPVVTLNGTASLTFDSPKSVHIARLNSSGKAASGAAFDIEGSKAQFTIINAKITSWVGTNTPASKPAGDMTAAVKDLQIKAGKVTMTNISGVTSTQTFGSASTNPINCKVREIQTASAGPVLQVKSAKMFTTQTYNPSWNYVSGTDSNGNAIPVNQVSYTITDSAGNPANLHVPGSYTVTFSYTDPKTGLVGTAQASLTVLQDESSIGPGY